MHWWRTYLDNEEICTYSKFGDNIKFLSLRTDGRDLDGFMYSILRTVLSCNTELVSVTFATTASGLKGWTYIRGMCTSYEVVFYADHDGLSLPLGYQQIKW